MVQEEIIVCLRQYVAVLNSHGLNVDKAFLFGSYARNEQHSDSDIDVLLLSHNFDRQNMNEKVKPWLYRRGIDIRIEPYTVGYDQFYAEDESLIVSVVRKEGVEISLPGI